MRRVRGSLWLPVLLCAAACWRSEPPAAKPFDVDRVSPALASDGEPLLLNDSITVYFTRPLLPISVTPVALAVLGADGHPVPGGLEMGSNWVTFTPEAPLAADLGDGSFRPGETYRLVVAGHPRPDAVRAADGRRLERQHVFDFRTAPAGPWRGGAVELPAPLRPPSSELPLLLRGYDPPPQLPADAPVLRLHFTVPVLPASARPEAFLVQMLGSPLVRLEPRSVRVVDARPVDQYPGATVEIDLGRKPRVHGSEEVRVLQEGDLLSVRLSGGEDSLLDLAGNPVLPAVPQLWSVAAGSSLALLTWPEESGGAVGDDPLRPGFEAQWGVARPRVRVEAGDGSLGIFRPLRDTVLRPGVAFDRGDGVMVTSRGTTFPFLAVDIPPDVRVRVEGGGAQLLACGGIRVAGELVFDGPGVEVPVVPHGLPLRELLDQAPQALVAAGDVVVQGRIATAQPLAAAQTALTIASAGYIHLFGELPYNTLLAVESPADRSRPERRVRGARGETLERSAYFEYGVGAGADFAAAACSPWLRMPVDRSGGVVHVDGADPRVQIACQTAPADPVDAARPDPRSDRTSRPRAVRDGEWVAVEPGSFVRFVITAEVRAGQEPPQIGSVRLADR